VARRTIHVLFVDDDPALVRLGALRLTRLGYQVTGCDSPEEALERFRDHPADFDALITDLSMPGMSGMELAREFLSLRPDLPILMVSGQFTPQDAAEARQIGVRCTLAKTEAFEQIPLHLGEASRR
jgi:CheY-like chemotaxis protein